MTDVPHGSDATPTPLLDMEPLSAIKKSRSTLRDRLLLVASALLAIAAGGMVIAGVIFSMTYPSIAHIADYLDSIFRPLLDAPDDFLTPLLLVGMLYPVIVVHELGHLLAGKIVHFRFNSMLIGPVSFSRSGQRIKFNVHTQTLFQGLTFMNIDRLWRLRRRLLIYIAGGPAASLISGALGILLIRGGLLEYNTSLAGRANAIFIGYSLLIGTTNLFPFHFRGLTSDGSKLLTLLRSPAKTRRWLSVIAVELQVKRNTRAKNWNGHWAKSAGSILDKTTESLRGNWLAYVRASDREDVGEAANYLEHCLQLLAVTVGPFREILTLEAAVFTAWFRNDFNKALAWYGRIKKPTQLPRLLHIRLEVAMACARSNFDTALTKWQEGLQLLQNSSLPQCQTDAWVEWRQEIEERMQKSNNQQSAIASQHI